MISGTDKPHKKDFYFVSQSMQSGMINPELLFLYCLTIQLPVIISSIELPKNLGHLNSFRYKKDQSTQTSSVNLFFVSIRHLEVCSRVNTLEQDIILDFEAGLCFLDLS